MYHPVLTVLRNDRRQPYVLVRVQECNTHGLDATLPGTPVVKYRQMLSSELINIGSVVAVVGSVQVNHDTWAIVDRSRNGVRAKFVDKKGDEFD